MDVISAIRSFKLNENEKNISVALSGGADSMALLYGLYMLKDQLNITVNALHLNHCLRGEEAVRDENFVKEQCKLLGVPLICKRVDVKKFAQENSMSIELAAREVRYKFFSDYKGDAVATAHNADDNIETVIYRLTRTTGIDGLCGIPARRDCFIRPLLCCSRAEIEEFIKEQGIPFVTDSTNLTDEYTRNVIRHKIVPVLKEISDSVVNSFSSTVKLINNDSNYLKAEAEKEFSMRFKDGKLNLSGFENLHTAIASRVISRFLFEESDSDNNYCINGVMEIALKKSGRFQIKGGKMVKAAKGVLHFENDKTVSFDVSYEEIDVNLIKYNEKINNLLLKDAIDCDKIEGELKIRTKEKGDKITFSHRKVTKPLTKWMNEKGIDIEIRDILPVISDNKGVVWVYGGGIDARVCPDDDTKRVYRVRYRQIGGN